MAKVLHGIDAPDGSKCIASRDYEEYRIEVYFGSDRKMYFRVYPKQFDPDGKPILLDIFDRANTLSTATGYPPIDFWAVIG